MRNLNNSEPYPNNYSSRTQHQQSKISLWSTSLKNQLSIFFTNFTYQNQQFANHGNSQQLVNLSFHAWHSSVDFLPMERSLFCFPFPVGKAAARCLRLAEVGSISTGETSPGTWKSTGASRRKSVCVKLFLEVIFWILGK